MSDRWGRRIAGFAAFQVVDAVACAKAESIQADLERLNCPPRVRRALPVIKAASAAGLLLGRRSPRLGRLTGGALSAYFLCAIGFHVRAKDPIWRSVPAASLLTLSAAVALHGYPDNRPVEVEVETPTTEAVVEGADVDVHLTTSADEPVGTTA